MRERKRDSWGEKKFLHLKKKNYQQNFRKAIQFSDTEKVTIYIKT